MYEEFRDNLEIFGNKVNLSLLSLEQGHKNGLRVDEADGTLGKVSLLGQLSIKEEAAGKVRVFAMVDI